MTDPSDDKADEPASSHGASGGPMELDTGDAGERRLWIPPDASEEEAAAIAAAIAAYLSARERTDSAKPTWDGDRWAFAGRLAAIGRRSGAVPSDSPRDPWTASGRSDRF